MAMTEFETNNPAIQRGVKIKVLKAVADSLRERLEKTEAELEELIEEDWNYHLKRFKDMQSTKNVVA